MTLQEKKTYILRNWRNSTGKRIAEMTKRYFASLPPKKTAPDIVKTAQEIFVS